MRPHPPRPPACIGLDFDNTIAGYDRLFATLAVEAGLLSAADADAAAGKRAVRDAVRRGEGGETAWRRLQALAYGRHMADAEFIPGVDGFLRTARERGIEIHIVSHKTRRAAFDPYDVDLRDAALAWMAAQGMFDAAGAGLSPDRVHFADTRGEKVRRIEALGCGAFVDDLEEVFAEPGFPAAIDAILYDPTRTGAPALSRKVTALPSWAAIAEHLLGVR